MYKKLLCALTLVSFLMVISCERTEKNTWRNVTSIDEILGEWEGKIYARYSEKPDLPMLEMPAMLSFFVDNNQNYIYEEIYDLEQVLDAFVEYAKIDGEVYLTKDELWEMVAPTDYISEGNTESFFEQYYFRTRMTVPFEELEKLGYSQYQVDQTGNRLKWFLNNDIVPETLIMQEEIILRRGK